MTKVTLLLLALLSPGLALSNPLGVRQIVSQGSSGLTVKISKDTDAAQWRKELSHFFKRVPEKNDSVAIRQEGEEQTVFLGDVVPQWMNEYSLKKAPAETNCYTTAFFAAGAIPDPFGFHRARARLATRSAGLTFSKEWVDQGAAVAIPKEKMSTIKLGDLLSVTDDKGMLSDFHVFIYLGNGLAFEQNSAHSQVYRFSILDSDYRPLHEDESGKPTIKDYPTSEYNPTVAFRILRSPYDWEKLRSEWSKQEPNVFADYEFARQKLTQLWFSKISLESLSKDDLKRLRETLLYCKKEYGKYKDGIDHKFPLDQLYVLCYSTLESYLKVLPVDENIPLHERPITIQPTH